MVGCVARRTVTNVEINVQTLEDADGSATTSEAQSSSAAIGGAAAAQGTVSSKSLPHRVAYKPAPQTGDEPTSYVTKGVIFISKSTTLFITLACHHPPQHPYMGGRRHPTAYDSTDHPPA